MTVREYDEYCEKIMSDFLHEYFYKQLNPKTIERIIDKYRQIQGIDVILQIDDKIYTIDEKASIRYINLKTFALELSFIGKNGNVNTGWLLDENKINDYYLLVWINELKHDAIYNINSIKNVDVALVEKEKILNYLSTIGWNKEKLKIKNNNIRNNPYEYMGNIKKYNCKFSYSKQLIEKPINILLPKETYIKLSEIYKNITMSTTPT